MTDFVGKIELMKKDDWTKVQRHVLRIKVRIPQTGILTGILRN